MKIISLSLIQILIFVKMIFPGSFSEKKIFTLEFDGAPDIYSFLFDKTSGNYCYVYQISNENKQFIISKKSLSLKYDYIIVNEILFDAKGNYFAVSGNYKADYGSDNYFLIINGKEVFNSNYIESYSAFIGKDGKYNFIFKENDKFYLGKIDPEGNLTKSGSYDKIKPLYRDSVNLLSEGDTENYFLDKYFYTKNGSRGFIVINNGIASLKFGDEEINTGFTDINETSITNDKAGKLTFIAKKNGLFFESPGNEFVNAGNHEYNSFYSVSPPIYFDDNNIPFYMAADSLADGVMNYYMVKGNQRMPAYFNNIPLKFISFVNGNIKISDDKLCYIGIEDVIIPSDNTNSEFQESNDYFQKYYYVKGENAYELGYNLSGIIKGNENKMLYTGIADLSKKEALIMESNGESRIILSEGNYDAVYNFGYTPSGEVYYTGETFLDSAKGKPASSTLFVGNTMLGKYDYVLTQGVNRNYSVLKFDSKGNFAYAASPLNNEKNLIEIYINGVRLPAPDKTPGDIKQFNSVLNLLFDKNDKLFYIAEFKPDDKNFIYQCFIDNKSTGESYESTGKIEYEESSNSVSFYAVRDKSIYLVNIAL